MNFAKVLITNKFFFAENVRVTTYVGFSIEVILLLISGQILNRFSGDVHLLDNELPWIFYDYAMVTFFIN